MSQHQYILISVKLDSSNKSSRFDGVYIPCRFCKTCLNLTKNNVYLSSALRSSAGPTEYSPPPFFFEFRLDRVSLTGFVKLPGIRFGYFRCNPISPQRRSRTDKTFAW
nr:hypothetical protein BMMJLCPH_00101 [Gallid alphaherpesvirus 2]